MSIYNQVDNNIDNISAATAHTIDFNGDGVHGIELNYAQSISRQRQIFTFNINNSTGSLENYNALQVANIELYPGAYASYILPNEYRPIDFNGDGITDLVGKETQGYQTSYSIWYHKGVEVQQEYTENVHYHKLDIDHSLVDGDVFYQDINNDGRTDIVKITSSSIFIYQSTGMLGEFEEVSFPNTYIDLPDATNFIFGDFSGDGNIEMLYKNGFTSANFLSLNPKSSTKDRRLKRVKNGFQQTAEFQYQTLASTAHNSNHGGALSYPLRKIYGSFPIVRWILTENTLGETVKTWYEFYSGIAHLQGKGFLGFEHINTRIENPAQLAGSGEPGEPFLEQKRTYSEFNLDYDHLILTPATSAAYAGAPAEGLGNLVTETSWDYSVVELGSNRNWVRMDGSTSHNQLSNVHQSESLFYDSDGNVTTKINVVGEADAVETTTATYEGYFTLDNWHISSAPSLITINTQRDQETPLVVQTAIEYNGDGTVLSRTSRPGTNAWSKVTFSYGNNPFGLLESKTITGLRPSEDGISANTGEIQSTVEITPIITDQYSYSANGRLVETYTDRFGFATQYTYYNRWGSPKSITDHLGRQSYFEYDGFGRIAKEVDHLGRVATTERSFYENYTGEDSECGSASDVLYKKIVRDENNELESIHWYNKFGQERLHDVTAQFGIVRTFKCYDKHGRLSSSRSPYFMGEDDYKTTEITYDQFNRVVSQSTNPVSSNIDFELLSGGGFRTSLTSNASDTRSTDTDATGRVVERKDSGSLNTLVYNYQSGGLLKAVKLNGQIVAANTYDDFGRQLILADPHASDITLYQYDAFDNLVFQKDNKNNTFRTYYDEYGRMARRDVEAPGLPAGGSDYTYEYYDSGHQNTLLKKETAPGGNAATEYTYNEDGNIATVTEIIDNTNYTSSFQYDDQGRVVRKEFPESGFAVRYVYENGFLEMVTTDSGDPIWSINAGGVNARGQLQKYTLGNGVSVENVYDPNHYFLESATATHDNETLFNFTYQFEPETGNLLSRKLGSVQEYFEYDNDTDLKLHRLTGAGQDPDEMDYNYSYHTNGNIQSKDGVGDYSYDPVLRNQVNKIDLDGGVDPNDPMVNLVGLQSVIYNYINSPSVITNVGNDHSVTFSYGPDDQRRKAVYKDGDTDVKTRIYAGSYEKQIEHLNQNNEIRVHYISAMGQLVAIYVEDDSELENDEGLNGKMYYPHQDHLGSIIHITDANGDIVYTQSFDPWGRTRNPNDLTYDNIPTRPDWLWRGYTGHEHLDEFGLINMNGRLYDPVVGRMLSPDNYVQNPDFSQSYNRYSYAWNNPLKYTDPSGELFIIPHIGVSSTGSVDIGISVGIGLPSGMSAQITVGHSFGNGGNTYATLSASGMGASAYVGYSSQGGWMAGAGVGIGPGMGGFSTNATSAGIQWSQNGGFSVNASVLSYNNHSGFNTHLSTGYSQGFEVGMRKDPITEPALLASGPGGEEVKNGGTILDNGGQPFTVYASQQDVIVGYKNIPYVRTMNTVPFALSAAAIDGPVPIGDVVGLVALAGAAAMDYYYFQAGNNNYPGPWVYTQPDPTQFPYTTYNNNNGGNGGGNWINWLIGGATGAAMIYAREQVLLQQNKIIPATPDNTYVSPPSITPYYGQ